MSRPLKKLNTINYHVRKTALLRYFHWSINRTWFPLSVTFTVIFNVHHDCDGKVTVTFVTCSKNSFENDLILVFSANGPQLIAEAKAY